MKQRSTVAWLVLACAALASCGVNDQLTKVLPTFANLGSIARELQRLAEAQGSVSPAEAERVMQLFEGGKDAWGSPFVFVARTDPEFSFVVVSLGSDQQLDVENVELYFDLTPEDTAGQPDRDIVFRDGHAITRSVNK